MLADKLTFDFSSKPVPAKSLIEVEKLTRVAIDAAMEVYCDVVPLEVRDETSAVLCFESLYHSIRQLFF